MKIKPLIETNPYLRNTVTMHKLVARSVRTSCGVEGIKPATKANFEIPRKIVKKIYQTSPAK